MPYSYSTDQENEVKRISTLSELQVVDDVMANILFKNFKTIKSNVCKNIYISTLFELGVVDDIMANILFKKFKTIKFRKEVYLLFSANLNCISSRLN